ncbi:MAG: hypothetical protein LBD85_05465 [Oscillospiraceae bacterium]|jgi:hypothetical protein|nr:hypothetical protein [Oscillospiraceae bacterium]
MAKIRIINDIARSSAALETTLETTLTRLKVIISDLSRSEPAIWVDNELSGYKMKSPSSKKSHGDGVIRRANKSRKKAIGAKSLQNQRSNI